MGNSNSIVFILPVTSQPRYHKRINAMMNEGYKCEIYSFERDYFKGDSDKMSFVSLGEISHGNYFKRIKVLIAAVYKLIKSKKSIRSSKCIYIFGFDNLILSVIARGLLKLNQPIIYEVADIRGIMFGKSLKSKMARMFEKIFVKKASLITVTSPFYLTEYYYKKLALYKKTFFVIENKLFPPGPKPLNKSKWEGNRQLVIGYFGLLRCQKSWDLLYELARNNPYSIKIYVRGYLLGLNNFYNRIKELDNIVYLGEYKSPEDLAELYSKVDISMVGNVSTNIENGKLALPNRLYESLYYNVPMVAHKDTGIAKRIQEMGAGWVVDFNNIEQSIQYIQDISVANYNKALENTKVNKEETVGNEDHKNLIELINRLK